jgi:hypothetical protein
MEEEWKYDVADQMRIQIRKDAQTSLGAKNVLDSDLETQIPIQKDD